MSHQDDEEWNDPRPRITHVTFDETSGGQRMLHVTCYLPKANDQLAAVAVAARQLPEGSLLRQYIESLVKSIQETFQIAQSLQPDVSVDKEFTGDKCMGMGVYLDEPDWRKWIEVRAGLFRAFTADTVRDGKELNKTLVMILSTETRWNEFNDWIDE
jgi:hypothetical protein